MQGKPTSKTCKGCGIEKPFAEFYPQKAGKYGFTSRCRKCEYERNKSYKESSDEAKEKARLYDLEWKKRKYAESPEYREKALALKKTPEALETKRNRRREWLSDPENRKKHAAAARQYRERKRENEEFEAFMARMEREEAEYENTNQPTAEGE